MTDELDSLDEALLRLHHGHQVGDEHQALHQAGYITMQGALTHAGATKLLRVYRINGGKLIEIGDRMRYDLQEATMTPPKASTVKRFRETWQAAVKAFRGDPY